VAYSLREEFVFAFAARFHSASRTPILSRRIEPVEISSRLEAGEFSALDAFLFVAHRVELVGSVGIRTNNIKHPLSEVSTFVVFLVEHTNQRLVHKMFKGVVMFLRDVESHNKAVALFYAECVTVFPYAARVLAGVVVIKMITGESATFFESLRFNKPIAVNFWNTVFAHFLHGKIKFLP